jgi:hypothetical protein
MGQFVYRDRWRIEDQYLGQGALGQLSSDHKFVNFQCTVNFSRIFEPPLCCEQIGVPAALGNIKILATLTLLARAR